VLGSIRVNIDEDILTVESVVRLATRCLACASRTRSVTRPAGKVRDHSSLCSDTSETRDMRLNYIEYLSIYCNTPFRNSRFFSPMWRLLWDISDLFDDWLK
jgi:hypothetical protein